MRQNLLVVATAFVIGGIATGAMLSQAQPVPPPAQETDATAPHPGAAHSGMGGWRHQIMHGDGEYRPFDPRSLALVYRQDDRNLSLADVQKIAEAFLLWHGNHTWKVSNVAPTSDGPIGFSLTTPEGSVVAKFTMDPHTGHVQRVG